MADLPSQPLSEEQIALLEGVDHATLAAAFGSRIAGSVKAAKDIYAEDAVRILLRSILDGIAPQIEEDEPMPPHFEAARDSWEGINHDPTPATQALWKSRIHERFVLSDGWEQWPEGGWEGSIKSLDSGNYVPTVTADDDFWYLNAERKILVHLDVNYQGELGFRFFGEGFEDIDELIDTVENYVLLPDPFEGKIVRMDGQGISTITPKLGEISSYEKDVESAVDWLCSIADPKIRKALAKAGVPARAGLLLEGPPGSGKTTLARRIALDLAGSTTVIYATPEVSVEEIFEFSNRYEPVLIVLEDVESFFGERGESDFSSFLNELDGFDQEPGKMILATTNDGSSFDEAIRRPGRLERHAVIAGVQPGAHEAMIAARLPKESSETIEELVAIVREKSGERAVTPAVLDSLARHSIMLRLKGKKLLRYAKKEWTPHYESESYLD